MTARLGTGGCGATGLLTVMLSCLLVVALGGCEEPPGPSEAMARRFIEAEYIRIDRDAALAISSGAARERIEQEIVETRGQPIGADTRRPEIRYELLDSRTSESGRQTHLFLATISPPGGSPFQRELWITTAEEPEGWRVVTFDERSAAAPSEP